MELKNKGIVDKEKKCFICDKKYRSIGSNNGIIILNKYICEECVDMITLCNNNDLTYNHIKDKIKLQLLDSKVFRY